MGQGGSSVPCQEIIARCLDEDHITKKHAAAGLRSGTGTSERSDFAEEIEYSTALDSTIDTLLSALYDATQRDSLYALKAGSLLMASAVQLEAKAGLELPQWSDGATPTEGKVAAALLAPLLRSAFKVDEDLFDELAAHPAVQLYTSGGAKSKGKEEADSAPASAMAPSLASRQQILEALEKSAGTCRA